MQIYVMLPNGKTVLIDVQLDKTTVQDVKRKIMEKSSIGIENQLLFLQDQLLSNEKKLEYYNIAKECKLECESVQSFVEKHKATLQETKDLLINERAINMEKLNEYEEQKQDFKKRLQDLENEKEQIEKQYKDSQMQITTLNAKLQTVQTGPSKIQQLIKPQDEKVQIKISELEMENIQVKTQLEFLNKERSELQQRLEDYNKIKEELVEQKYEVKSLQKELEFQRQSGQKAEGSLERELQNTKDMLKKKELQVNELQNQVKEFEVEKMKVDYQKTIDLNSSQQLMNQSNYSSELERRIEDYKVKISSLNQQVAQLQENQRNSQQNMMSSFQDSNSRKLQQELFELQTQHSKLQAEYKAKDEAYNESQQKLSEARKNLFEKDQKIKELEVSVDNIRNLMRDRTRQIKDKEQQIELLQIEIQNLNGDKDLYRKQTSRLQEVANKINPNQVIEVDKEFLIAEQELKRREEQRKIEQREIDMRRERDNEKRAYELKLEQQQILELKSKDKQSRAKAAKFLRQQMMDSHGKIEVCFLIDITASMDPYKEQAMKCITESMKNIKIKTNRDALWASVAYQDFGELKQLGGSYHQINFTPEAQAIQNFLQALPCTGGGDYAEDIRGGIMQMLKTLNWQKSFKIAVLICDAPTHGKRYNAGVSDRYPNEDIEDAINLLIQQQVLFVGILFNRVTLTMFEEIKKIYKAQDKEELFFFADMANTEEGKIWQELVDLVSQASVRATQTNNSGTKTKNPVANKSSSAGAMEALCKQIKNPMDFQNIPGVKTIPVKFKVLRVDLIQNSFENNIENIRKLDLKRDYSVTQEGEWDCIRTEKFFAQGQMKQVFLMKKQNNQNELYVIKMPLGDRTYSSIDQAIYECRSHLISKCVMRKFIRELQEARDRIDRNFRFPEPQYSDFLILQESQSSFWIAERYFTGDFVKYNNNYGFISDENSELNHLAQAFTYYSYFISNFNYMISDVQGVGMYFTDPALNTKDGGYDETDMGYDGQSMFMVSYEGKKHIGQRYLDLLKIKME